MSPDNVQTKKKLPLAAKIFYAAGIVSAVLYGFFMLFPAFSDFFNRYISSVFRAILAHLTGWIPFSLAEFIIILSPLFIFLFVKYGLDRYSDSWRDVGIYCLTVLSIVALMLSLFTVAFAPGYRGTRLADKLDLEEVEIDKTSLFETADFLASSAAKEVNNIKYNEEGFSVMPYDYNEMGDLLIEAYDKACEKYSFIQKLDSNLKPVMLSELMSYTHITGVYTFFTGEANINIAFPDYTVPFTAAHELAHQRGIAREDEANFVAFLVCMESDDPYIRYSGYLNTYEYVANVLYRADTELYYDVYYELPFNIAREMSAYSHFFEKYSQSVAAEVSGAVNNTFLTIQGTEGTISYNLVVDLAVRYYYSQDR